MPSAMELLRNYRGNAPKPLPPEERRGLGNFDQALKADLDRVDWQKRSDRVLGIEDKVLTVAEMLDTIGQFRPDLKKLAKRYPVLIPAIFAVACNTTPPTGGNLESKPPIVQPQYIEKTTPIVEIGPTPTPIPTDTPTPPPTDTPTPLPTYTPTVAPTDTPTVAPTETITPTETMQPPAQIKVVSKSLNVRPGPGTNYPEVLEVLKEGDTAKIVGKADNGWWEVVTVSGTTGWVSGDEQYTTASNADDVQVVETPPPPPTATPRPATATPESNTSIRTVTNTIGADVFVFDGIGGTRIGTFTNGAVAEVLEDNGPWLKVKLIDNTIGYIISIASSPIIETPQQVGVFDITGPPSGNKLAELAVNGGISGDPTIAFLDGGRFQESGVAYHALVVEGAGVTLEGSNYIVTLSSGNTITIPKLVSRIVVWVNGTQLGPGWMDVLATSRDVQPDYLQGPFAYDATTGTLVLSY